VPQHPNQQFLKGNIMFLVEITGPGFEPQTFTCENATEVQRVLTCEYQVLLCEEFRRSFSVVRPSWRQLILEPHVSRFFSANHITYYVSPLKPGKHSEIREAREAMIEEYGLDVYDRVVTRFGGLSENPNN
jgi:hypothetical protein